MLLPSVAIAAMPVLSSANLRSTEVLFFLVLKIKYTSKLRIVLLTFNVCPDHSTCKWMNGEHKKVHMHKKAYVDYTVSWWIVNSRKERWQTRNIKDHITKVELYSTQLCIPECMHDPRPRNRPSLFGTANWGTTVMIGVRTKKEGEIACETAKGTSSSFLHSLKDPNVHWKVTRQGGAKRTKKCSKILKEDWNHSNGPALKQLVTNSHWW